MPFVHMTPPVHAVNALTGPPVHVMSPSTVYHQPPIVFHQPHFQYPGYGGFGGFGGYGGYGGYGGFGGFAGGPGYFGRSTIPENAEGDDNDDSERDENESHKYKGKSKREIVAQKVKRQWFGWHPFPHTVNVGPHTPPIHVGPHYPPVHIGPHVPAVHIGPHVPVINVPSHVPAIHVRPHVPAVHLGPPVPIINAGNHFPAVHVTSPPTIYHRPPIVIHQPHIVHPYGGWKKRSKIAKAVDSKKESSAETVKDESEQRSGDKEAEHDDEKPQKEATDVTQPIANTEEGYTATEESSGDSPENSGETTQAEEDKQVNTRSVEEASTRSRRQMFSNANSGPNGDSVIFVHPNEHGGASPAGLGDLAAGHGSPLEGGNPGEAFGDLSAKAFGEDSTQARSQKVGKEEKWVLVVIVLLALQEQVSEVQQALVGTKVPPWEPTAFLTLEV